MEDPRVFRCECCRAPLHDVGLMCCSPQCENIMAGRTDPKFLPRLPEPDD